MPLDLLAIPLTDHHCHTLVDASWNTDVELFIRCASEAPAHYPLSDLQETVTFRTLLALVREVIGRPVHTAADLADALCVIDYASYCRKLFTSRGYRELFVDTGFSPTSGLSLPDLARITGTSAWPVLRLERLAEELYQPGRSFDSWWEDLRSHVAGARRNGYVGAKSIAAYRTGLAVHRVARDDAAAAYRRWTERAADGHAARLAEADLIHYILWEIAPLLAQQSLPLQFHAGYGDPDEDLARANPLLLRTFLEHFTPQGLRVVLLHTYPYHREAGYLASVYPGVYFDVSLIIPHGITSARRVVAEALELAPMSRFLFASDAHTRPEMFALAADAFRDALSHFFASPAVVRSTLPSVIERWCAMILGENARRLYLDLEGQ